MMSSNMENVAPQVLRSVIKQAQTLAHEKLEGIQVILNDDDMTDIQAIIEGPPGTPYMGGSFRVKLVLSRDYPVSPPKGFFLTKIFHPNVGPQGEICVSTLKKDWKPDLGIKHILLIVKCLLIAPNPESALNEEAGKLLLEQYGAYCERARLYTEIHASKLLKGGTGGGGHGQSETASSKANTENRKRCDASSESGGGGGGVQSGGAQETAADKKEKKGKLMTKDKKRTLKRL